MAKKIYYIPTIEIVSVRTAEMMWELGASGSHGSAQVPKPRNFGTVPNSVPAF